MVWKVRTLDLKVSNFEDSVSVVNFEAALHKNTIKLIVANFELNILKFHTLGLLIIFDNFKSLQLLFFRYAKLIIYFHLIFK